MNHEAPSDQGHPKQNEADDNSTHESLCVSPSDCSHVQFSENKERLFLTRIVNDSNYGSQDDAEENQGYNHNGARSVNACWLRIELPRQVFFICVGSRLAEDLSRPAIPSPQWADGVSLTVFASSVFRPNGPGRTRCALNAIASHSPERTVDALRLKVVLRILVKVLVLTAIVAIA